MKEEVTVGQMARVQGRVSDQVPWMCVYVYMYICVYYVCVCLCVFYFGDRGAEEDVQGTLGNQTGPQKLEVIRQEYLEVPGMSNAKEMELRDFGEIPLPWGH